MAVHLADFLDLHVHFARRACQLIKHCRNLLSHPVHSILLFPVPAVRIYSILSVHIAKDEFTGHAGGIEAYAQYTAQKSTRTYLPLSIFHLQHPIAPSGTLQYGCPEEHVPSRRGPVDAKLDEELAIGPLVECGCSRSKERTAKNRCRSARVNGCAPEIEIEQRAG